MSARMVAASAAVLAAAQLCAAQVVDPDRARDRAQQLVDGREAAALDTPPPPAALLATLEAPYLTQEELKDLRVFHGLFNPDDLDTAERRARAALHAGLVDDPAFADAATPPLLRAEGLILLGEVERGLEILDGVEQQDAWRTLRLRGQGLLALGRREAAREVLERISEQLAIAGSEAERSAAELTDGARALRMLARLRGASKNEYERIVRLLSTAHQGVDRLYWPALVEEAELLLERGNFPEAQQAAAQAVSLNPASARAWTVFGLIGVASLNYDLADGVAARLDAIANRLGRERGAVSAEAAMVRARRYIRQDEPPLAEQAMAAALEAMPKRRDLRALHAAVTALRYVPAEIEAELTAFDELAPGAPDALLEVGSALSERRQYGAAAEYLERALERNPNWVEPWAELGLMEMQSGRDAAAVRALRKAAELDPFNTRVRNSLRLIEELLTFERIESEHFDVRYRSGDNAVLAREMLEPLERIHAEAAELFEHEPGEKTLIDLMPDSEYFAVRIVGMPQIHTVAACTGPVIAMEAPRFGKLHMGLYDWERTLRHEYVHTVTLSMTRNRIPHWFTEAAAVYFEYSPMNYSWAQLLTGALQAGELFDMEQINTAFARPEKPTDRTQAYAQGYWMYRFMIDRWGASAPLRLMERYAEGMREEEAVPAVLGVSRDEFYQEFLTWAVEDARSWGMLPEPSVKRLRLDLTLRDKSLGTAAWENLREYGERFTMALGGVGHRPGTLGGASVLWLEPPELELKRVSDAQVARWLAQHPDHPDLIEMQLQRETAQTGGAATLEHAALLERLAAARPVDPTPHMTLARLYLDSEEPARAIPHLEYLDERENYTPVYAAELAKLYAAERRWADAHASAVRATRVNPFDANHRELAAAAAIRMGDFDAAEHQLRALIELEPQRADRHRQRLDALQRMRGG
jgi:tetratricopeptide (TPR) repeat protein